MYRKLPRISLSIPRLQCFAVQKLSFHLQNMYGSIIISMSDMQRLTLLIQLRVHAMHFPLRQLQWSKCGLMSIMCSGLLFPNTLRMHQMPWNMSDMYKSYNLSVLQHQSSWDRLLLPNSCKSASKPWLYPPIFMVRHLYWSRYHC